MATQQGGPSTAEPSENTPLLEAETSHPDTPAQRSSNDEQEDAESQSLETRRLPRPSLARIDKSILITFALSLATAALSIIFNAIHMPLSFYGRERFGFYGSGFYWRFDEARAVSFWAFIICGVIAAMNVARLRKYGRTLSPLVNIIVFGVVGCIATLVTTELMSFLLSYSSMGSCNENLKGGPGDGEAYYPGTYGECQQWLIAYYTIICLFLASALLTSILYVAVTIMFLVKTYRNRAQIASELATGSRFTLPSGYISVDFAIRWGGAQTRTDGEAQSSERRGEESRGEERSD